MSRPEERSGGGVSAGPEQGTQPGGLRPPVNLVTTHPYTLLINIYDISKCSVQQVGVFPPSLVCINLPRQKILFHFETSTHFKTI